MSTDKSQAAHESARDANLPLGDLSAKPVDAKTAGLARGGSGKGGVDHADFVIVKTLDKATTRLD